MFQYSIHLALSLIRPIVCILIVLVTFFRQLPCRNKKNLRILYILLQIVLPHLHEMDSWMPSIEEIFSTVSSQIGDAIQYLNNMLKTFCSRIAVSLYPKTYSWKFVKNHFFCIRIINFLYDISVNVLSISRYLCGWMKRNKITLQRTAKTAEKEYVFHFSILDLVMMQMKMKMMHMVSYLM